MENDRLLPGSKAHPSEFVLVVVVVEGFFLDQIQLDRIQTYDFELNSALFTIYCLAFIHI